MKILALDPGERVGYITAEVVTSVQSTLLDRETQERETTDFDDLVVIDHGIAFLKDMALAVFRALVGDPRDKDYDVVVMEGFKLTPKGAKTSIGSTMQTCQFIGMVRLACWLSNTRLVTQWPVDMQTARRRLNIDHPSADAIRKIVESADAVAHDDGHDGSAALHLWHHFTEEYL